MKNKYFNKMGKIFFWFACVSIIVITACEKEPEWDENGGKTGDLEWTFSDDGVLTITGNSEMPDFYEPPWYPNKELIRTVIIGNNVKSIGSYAFKDCSALTKITIPNSVIHIRESAFSHCTALTDITIPNGVNSIGRYVFSYCNSLESITIPNSVIHIGEEAFYYCKSLQSIEVDTSNPVFSSENGVLFNKSKNILFRYPLGKQGSYIIPDGVVIIKGYAFDECDNLPTLTIPNSVKVIEDMAIGCYYLKTVIIMATVPPSLGYYNYVAPIGYGGGTLKVPPGSLSAYKTSPTWGSIFATIVVQ